MANSAHNWSIHIVDDDPNVLESLALLLRFMGHAPYPYVSAQEFLDTAQIKPSDVLLFDLHMPDINGFLLLAQVQARQPGAKAMLMTGYGNADVEREAFQLGFKAVLHKPFSETDLCTALDATSAVER